MSKWVSKLFHQDDNNRISERALQIRMLLSAFCIMLCMTAMLSSAYAWFSASVSSGMNTLSSASYTLKIKENDGADMMAAENGIVLYECDLTYFDEHYFTLTSDGTATQGYCEIIVTGPEDDADVVTYYTTPIKQGDSLDVCIQAASGSEITFVPMWGTYEAQTVYSLRRPSVFTIQHSMTPHIEYLVVEGVTLEALAEYYGVSVEDICIYNGISELEVGETIKIPGIEDDSIEPYMPPQAGVATPSNATPSDATQQTGVEPATESTLATESSVETESTPAVESSTTIESTSAEESSAVTESTSATETTITTESVPATEAENLPESTSATQSESVIFTAPDPTSSDAASSGEEPADPSIPPEMPTEDIEAMSETEVTEPGTEAETPSEPS